MNHDCVADIKANWEERAAIMEYDGGLDRKTSEVRAWLRLTQDERKLAGTLERLRKV